MKLAIIGYGKMGRKVEALAAGHGFESCVTIDNMDEWITRAKSLSECQVAVEFTTPDTAPGNVARLADLGIPVVSGTTGWNEKVEETARIVEEKGTALLVSSNFSLGMNLFFNLNRYLAALMNPYNDYSPSIGETHHIHKLDAPSGTAISLANGLIRSIERLKSWAPASSGLPPEVLPVTSVREGEIIGIHTVSYTGTSDILTITHEALNRDGLAYGALLAARWIIGKKGLFTMDDMLFKQTLD